MSEKDNLLFIIPTFEGTRFAEHEVPVELLGDLVAYREILVHVAKRLYREHYGRARVPKGFEKNFQLTLVEVRQGSTGLALARHGEPPPPPKGVKGNGFDPFAAALLEVGNVVNAASTGRVPDLQKRVSQLFGNLGKRLRDEDKLVFKTPGGAVVGTYTANIRKNIILTYAETYERELEISGRVEGLDRPNGTFKIVSDDNQRPIELPLRPADDQTLTTALAEHNFTWVEVTGTGTYDRNDNLKGFQIKELELTAAIDTEEIEKIDKRLNELKLVEAGWDDGEGEQVRQETVAWVRGVILTAMAHDEMGAPFLYPTKDGGIRAEWSFGAWEVSAEFRPNKSALMSAVNVNTHEYDETEVKFEGAPDEEIEVSTYVNRYVEGVDE